MQGSPYLIAITGGSGSGKSTLARALQADLAAGQAIIFEEDGYYWPRQDALRREAEAGRSGQISEINYDDPASKDIALMVRHLAALKAGQAIDQPIYDYDRHDRLSQTQRVEPVRLIIIDGIHAASVASIRALLDLTVYVDTPDDLRLARRLRRDIVERERSVDSVLQQYLGTVRSAHYQFTYPAMFHADLVIADEGLPAYTGFAPSEAAIARMLAPLRTRLQADGVFKS